MAFSDVHRKRVTFDSIVRQHIRWWWRCGRCLSGMVSVHVPVYRFSSCCYGISNNIFHLNGTLGIKPSGILHRSSCKLWELSLRWVGTISLSTLCALIEFVANSTAQKCHLVSFKQIQCSKLADRRVDALWSTDQGKGLNLCQMSVIRYLGGLHFPLLKNWTW